jgi:ribose/xylose/arabinose/galactoside ABC-type transport system permease subunit
MSSLLHNIRSKIISNIEKFYSKKSASILSIFIIIILVFYILTPEHRIVDMSVISVILRTVPELGIIAVGITILMICQEFDLSVGSLLALSSMIMVWSYNIWGLHVVLASLLSLIITCLAAILNGLITVKTNIPSFITTLGMMMWWRGVVLVLTGGHPVPFHPEESCPLFKEVLIGEIGIIPLQFIWFIIITLVFHIVLEYTKFGNWVYSTGGNKEAAKEMGINTDLTKIICFMIVGLLTGFAGVIQATRINGSNALQGQGMEMEAIAATVIGGTSLFGGVGSVVGTLIGVLLIRVLEAGLLLMRFSAYWFQAIVGLLIIISVVSNVIIEKRRKIRSS